jgi:hypothetical protein
MGFQEMPQCHEQIAGMLNVSGVKRLVNIMDDHGPDGFCPARLVQQIARQSGSGNPWNVLVLADCSNLGSSRPQKAIQSSIEIIGVSSVSNAIDQVNAP